MTLSSTGYAHSGGTNADGCHTNHQNESYHCHNEREPGAYARQMEGYRRSTPLSGWLWLLVIGGILLFLVVNPNTTDKKPPSTNQKTKEDYAKESQDKEILNESQKRPFRFQCDIQAFSNREIEILQKYGNQLSALSLGKAIPKTNEQQNFLDSCEQFRTYSVEEMRRSFLRNEFSSNEIQLAWLKYLYRIKSGK